MYNVKHAIIEYERNTNSTISASTSTSSYLERNKSELIAIETCLDA